MMIIIIIIIINSVICAAVILFKEWLAIYVGLICPILTIPLIVILNALTFQTSNYGQ